MSFNPVLPGIADFLLRRRSVKAKTMREPGPDAAGLETILKCGLRVPDHGKLAPWKLIVLDKKGQAALAAVAEAAHQKEEGRPAPKDLALTLTSAPTLVVAASILRHERPIPEIEQRLSAGALCQNMLIAATALGFAANWLTGWAAYSPGVKTALGLRPEDIIAGFLYFGTGEVTEERPRPAFHDVVRFGF